MKPMRRYRASDMPVTCAVCGETLRWVVDRFAWVHTARPPKDATDHAPRPVGAVA